MRPIDYLDRIRPLTETGSDYAVAKLLGISEDAVNQYRRGLRTMDNYAALRIAEVLKIPLDELIAAIELEREKRPEKREKWRALLKRHGRYAAIALLGLAATLPPGEANCMGMMRNSAFGTMPLNNNYATWRRLIWGIRRMLVCLAPV